MHRYWTRLVISGLLSAGVAGSALAEGDKFALRTEPLPKYVQECGSCHIAFPPALLPAESWRRLMGGLQKHYGTDASLDAAIQRELANWLAANAATGKFARGIPAPDRITRATWFSREHSEVAAVTWKSAAVKSATNCGACHEKATEGDFDEHRISIPR
jgi:cytochrome c553